MDKLYKENQYKTAATMANIHEIIGGVVTRIAGNDIAVSDNEKLHDDINAALGRQLPKKEV